MKSDSNPEKHETELEIIMELIEKRSSLNQEYMLLVRKYPTQPDLVNSPEYKEIIRKKKEFANDYILTPDEMRIIIEEKNAKKVQDRQLNCSVFDNMKSLEFKKFLEYLIKNSHTLVAQRFQIIIQSSRRIGFDYHWSAADILVKENEIQILHFDTITASDDDQLRGGLNGDELEEVLKSVASSIPIKLIDSYTQIDNKIVDIQYDTYSCSIYALSSALTMSKISNLHDLTKDKLTPESKAENNVMRYSIESTNLPAILLKNVQSYSVIENYEKTNQKNDLNKIQKKNQPPKTLKEYAAPRSYVDSNTKKTQNVGVLFTREHYKKIVKKNKQDESVHTEKKPKAFKK